MSDESDSSRKWPSRRVSAALITLAPSLVAALVTLPRLGDYRPLTTHEAWVARTALEMINPAAAGSGTSSAAASGVAPNGGDWIVPHWMGEPRLRKPPLAYWLTAACLRVTGRVDTFAARLPAALAGIVLATVVAGIGSRLFGRRVGLAAGVIHASSIHFILQARLAEADIHLALLVALALALALGARVTPGANLTRWFGVGVATALAMLAKGPVALVFIVPPLIALFVGRRIVDFRAAAPGTPAVPSDPAPQAAWRTGFAAGALFLLGLLLVGGSWPALVLWREPQAAGIWWRESLGRFAEDPNGTVRYPGYYLVALAWLTLPWGAIGAALALRSCFSRNTEVRPPVSGQGEATSFTTSPVSVRFLLTWGLAPLVILSLSAGKQEHYLIPSLAAWSVLAAKGLMRRETGGMGLRRFLGLAGLWIGILILFLELVQPGLHAGLEADRAMARFGAGHRGERLVILGHPVQRLAFFWPGPTRFVDAVENLPDDLRLPDTEVPATGKASSGPSALSDSLVLTSRLHADRLRDVGVPFEVLEDRVGEDLGPKTAMLIRLTRP
jgi:hypothetical protein